ncbi:zinc-ribbon domain-containing protein [Glaciihabitans tibetensis]
MATLIPEERMPENVEQWWARRQRSKSTAIPYPVGQFRSDWERYPVLVRQYHPEFNHGITLTQVPPAADVYLLWQCDVGHLFVATPEEQRSRPGGSRRRSTWCPDCATTAVNRPAPACSYAGAPAKRRPDAPRAPQRASAPAMAPALAPVPAPVPAPYACGHPRDPDRVEKDPADDRCYLCRRLDSSPLTRQQLETMVVARSRVELSNETSTSSSYSWECPRGHGVFAAKIERVLAGKRCPTCAHARVAADGVAVGESFVSPWAPKPASAAEADLRQRLRDALLIPLDHNAVRVARPFFTHVEVWPDFVMPEFRVAIEYDTTGRDGLEHVGRREDIDRRKDRLLRAAGWEVIRIRCGKLQPLGLHDLQASGVTNSLVTRIVDELAQIRGELIVRSYLA